MYEGIVEDTKQHYRLEQIETEGNDPLKTAQSFGTPHDLAAMSQEGEDAEGAEEDKDRDGRRGAQEAQDHVHAPTDLLLRRPRQGRQVHVS